MKRSAVLLFVIALLLAASAPDPAWGHGRHWHRQGFRTGVFVGVGPSFWWGAPYPYWWYYPPPYYRYSAPVVIQEPPVYIEQQPPPAAAAPEAYWYYCQDTKAYYPDVPTCSAPWIKVPPRTE